MPSELFLKLSEEKQQRIREAAIAEFSRVSFEEASINRIIKDADISRGSFYTYFEDKTDLIRYLMKNLGARFQGALVDYLREENGDFFRMAERLYQGILIWSETTPDFKMVRNVFSNMDRVMHLIGKDETDTSVYNSRRFRAMCGVLYEYTSHELIRVPKSEFPEFAEMVLTISIRDGMHTCCNPEKESMLRRAMKLQFAMLRDGVGGRENTATEEKRNLKQEKTK